VFKVVTHKDIKGKNRITGLITFPTNLGDGWDRPILCDDKVYQYGDAIAIVCADTAAQAKAAAEKVKVDLEELPAYMSAPAAMADDAMEIHPAPPIFISPRKSPRAKTPSQYSKKPMWWWKTISTSAASRTCPWSRTSGVPI
jgi:aldehyde oxidoreductase